MVATCRRVVSGIFVCSLALSILAVTDADAAGHRAHQFNTFGNKGVVNYNIPEFASADIVVADVAYDPVKPLTISLNEVCFDQYQNIEYRLVSQGYTGTFSASLIDVGSCGGPDISGNPGPFGNAVFTVGGKLGTYRFSYHSQDYGFDAEIRNMVCVRFDAYAIIVACSTHLDNDDTLARNGQLDEYLDTVMTRYSSRCRFVSGDLNEVPLGHDHLDPPYYVDHDEADPRPPTSQKYPTTDSGLPIDYIFVDKARQHRTGTVPTRMSVASSDHHHYTGYFEFDAGAICV
jgi:endonuclease/exonuclease/phosphatase family metal-dependent hydrolase